MTAPDTVAADPPKDRALTIRNAYFACPYCGKKWDRGGRKEGFVKSGASNHVWGCYTIVLADLGLAPTSQYGGLHPLADAYPRHRRSVTRLRRSREREGLSPHPTRNVDR